MAYVEDVLTELQTAFDKVFPTYLLEVQREHTDGILLEPFHWISWEEDAEVPTTPAIMLLAQEESDMNLRDQLVDATILAVVVLREQSKRFLTRKLFRYAEAIRRMVRQTNVRTLSHVVTSIKVERVQYSPIYVDEKNRYARDFQATLQLRMPRERV